LVQEFSAKIVLEVFGGGGAIWGFSEVLGLRTTENRDLWRTIAMFIAFLFFLRWSRQLRSICLILSSSSSLNALDQKIDEEDTRNIRIHASKEAGGTAIAKTTTPSMRPRKKNVNRSRSPIGIQLSSFFFGDKKNTDDNEHSLELDEEDGLFQQKESSESTALKTPKS
jgi:hypothetical protein